MTESDQQVSNVEKRTVSVLDSLRSALAENSRILLVGGGLVLVLQWAGIISLGLPSWWPIGLIVIGAGGVAGWMASDRLYSLIPEDEQIVLVSFNATDGTGGEIWSLHPDEFENLEVESGDLYQWDESPTRCYEVRSYDPEENVAVGNWRETKPASELAAKQEIEDVHSAVEELRGMLEPEAKRARTMRRQISGIVRVLDARRDREQNRSLERATVDSDIEDASISNVLDDVLDDDLIDPPRAGGGDERTNGHAEDGSVEIETDQYDAILDSDDGENPPLGGL